MLLLLITTYTVHALPSASNYLNMTQEEQIEFSILQRNYFESSGRLPKLDVHVNNKVVYSPSQWVDRAPSSLARFSIQTTNTDTSNNQVHSSSSSMTVTCPDGTTICDSKSFTCAGCYCYIPPATQTIYGVTREGGNVNCVWSNCYCFNLLR